MTKRIRTSWAGLAVLLIALGCSAPEPEGAAEPEATFPAGSNILLITIDTLRADHLGSYGYPRDTSPVLDKLAAEGVRFDQTAVQWPKTGPSFASIFTATYSKDNEIVRKVGIPLPFEFRMLAEELQAQGYQTRAVVANGAVAKDFHFDQGFDTFIETWKLEEKEPGMDLNGAEAVTDLARSLASGLDPDRPYFLWVHYLDPHFPYTPPADYADRFQNDEWFDAETMIKVDRTKDRQQMTGIGKSQVLDEREDMGFYVARYDAEIAYTDGRVGELLEFMTEQGLMDSTLTVVSSDHGESLGDHRYYFDHGRFSFQTCVRVPLLVHYPGVIEPGVVAEPVELINLTPTLLDLAGVQLDGGRWMQGRSLAPLLLGDEGGDGFEMAFTEAGYSTGGQWQKVVRDDRFKLIYAPKLEENRWIGGPDVPFALYDLEADPDELENVAEAFPEDFKRLQKALSKWTKAEPFRVLVDDSTVEEATDMDDETREQLEALGYL